TSASSAGMLTLFAMEMKFCWCPRLRAVRTHLKALLKFCRTLPELTSQLFLKFPHLLLEFFLVPAELIGRFLQFGLQALDIGSLHSDIPRGSLQFGSNASHFVPNPAEINIHLRVYIGDIEALFEELRLLAFGQPKGESLFFLVANNADIDGIGFAAMDCMSEVARVMNRLAVYFDDYIASAKTCLVSAAAFIH